MATVAPAWAGDMPGVCIYGLDSLTVAAARETFDFCLPFYRCGD